MKLILIEREEENISWDEYEAFVIAADDVDEAITISCKYCKEMIDETLKIKIICDQVNPDIDKGVVFSSYRTG